MDLESEFNNLINPEGVTTDAPATTTSKLTTRAERHNKTERKRVKELNRLFQRIHRLLCKRGKRPKDVSKRAILESVEEFLQ